MVSKFIIHFLSWLFAHFVVKTLFHLVAILGGVNENYIKAPSQNHVTNGNSHLPQDLFILNNNMSDNNGPANTEEIKCACGKKCKGLRGLKAHQR